MSFFTDFWRAVVDPSHHAYVQIYARLAYCDCGLRWGSMSTGLAARIHDEGECIWSFSPFVVFSSFACLDAVGWSIRQHDCPRGETSIELDTLFDRIDRGYASILEGGTSTAESANSHGGHLIHTGLFESKLILP